MRGDGLAGAILASARERGDIQGEPAEDEAGEDLGAMGIENAAADLIAAVKGGSPSAAAEALRAAFSILRDSE